MIKTAVWSFWEDNRSKINGGFRTKKELAMCLALSLEEAKKQFQETILVTNSFGKSFLIDQYKLPFDKVLVELDRFDNVLNPDHWAYIKIYTYNLMARKGIPFIHIDNDVIIWDKISSSHLEAPLLFQNRESLKTHTGYRATLAETATFPDVCHDVFATAPEYALNCGIVGANDLKIINEWFVLAHQYVFSPRNAHRWKEVGNKHSHNHVFEQYLISALVAKKGMQNQIATLLGLNFWSDAAVNFKYTHLWGEAKRVPETMEKLRNRLYKDYPKYEEVFEIQESHQHIFDDIYRNELWGQGQGSGGGSLPEVTKDYRKFLSTFLQEKKIASVADFGCGDWQFSKYVDWTGIKYDGFDCVPHIVDKDNREYASDTIKFYLADRIEQIEGSYDLLIVKDVLIHWTNTEIHQFFKTLREKKQFKYVLITADNSDMGKYEINKDIRTGQFHRLNLRAEPFNILEADPIFIWQNTAKTTYLLTDY